MTRANDILKNYLHQKHFLQLVNVPTTPPAGGPFLYMKNHKAACTTVLATLLAHLLAEKGEGRAGIDMETIHTPPKNLLLTGARGLSVQRVMKDLSDPGVFRFTVVRDPVARTVSAFADKIVRQDKQKRKLMRHLGRPDDGDITLSEFLDIMARDPSARDIDRHWRNQCKEISFGLIDYDFIGDMADLNSALHILVRRCFAVDAPQIEDTRKSLGHASKSGDLIAALTRTDRKNIEVAFGDDLEMYACVQKNLADGAYAG